MKIIYVACAALLSCPAEVTLVRICNDVTLPVDKRRNYTGVGNALSRIVKEEGALRKTCYCILPRFNFRHKGTVSRSWTICQSSHCCW